MGNCLSISVPVDKACAAVGSGAVDYAFRKTKYKRNLKSNLGTLDKEWKRLLEVKDDVLRRVNNEEQQPQMQRLKQVEGWLQRVEAERPKIVKLLGDSSQEVEKLCLGGLCYKDYKFSSFRFGDKVVGMLQVLKTLMEEAADFNEVADRVPDDPADDRIPCEPTVGLESIFDEFWRYLEEDQMRIIGLYGKGGVGKTTLLKKIYKKLRETSTDSILVRVSVTNNSLEKIQDEIAKKTRLYDESGENKSCEEKTLKIHTILSMKKFVLLLDDLWEHVDLIKVGVPHNPNVASKVVFTTRLCGLMKADHMIEVECLEHEDAVKLFRSIVGDHTLESHEEIPALAEIMAKECGGLPLALIKVAQSMIHMNTPQEWEYAINVLTRRGYEFSGMQEVYRSLKLSYDNLPKDPTIRSCFLYCNLFPKSHKIFRRGLIDCWIGEGFLDDKSEAQNKGYHIIGILLNAGLLEEVEDDQLKLPGVTCDLASWIARNDKGKEKIVVYTGAGLTEVPEIGEWEGARRMSVMGNQIEILPETPSAHHLQTLFLNDNNLKAINGGFFQFLPCLQVLNLSNNPSLTELPSEISNLVSLQLLDVSRTAIKELSKELKALSNLRCLNLEHTSGLQTIPQPLISNFSMLQVLRMLECGALSQDGESLIRELLCLQRLEMLDVSLKGSPALQRFLSSRKLLICTQSLGLQSLHDTKFIKVFLSDLKNLKALDILDCTDLEDVQINCEEWVENIGGFCGFRNLSKVNISSCLKLRDLTWLILAPSLKVIVISDCSDLEELIGKGRLGEFPEKVRNRLPFAKLQVLELRRLQKFRSIYWNALPFQDLQNIAIINCPLLKSLPLDSNSTKEGRIVIMGERQWWEDLQWEDQATRNAFDPCFKHWW